MRPPADRSKLPHAAGSPLAEQAAARIVPALTAMFQPRTAIDVGCGTGAFTAALLGAGVDTFGADGPELRPYLLFNPDHFIAADLAGTFELPSRFDLVLSLEVAEHLPARTADTFVRTLIGLGDLVVFSAASPHQSGPGHVNLQWPGYWAGIFQAYGYACADALRPVLWNDGEVAWYYRQNMLVFGTPDRLFEFDLTPTDPLALVHPDHLAAVVRPSGRRAALVLMDVAQRRLRRLF